MASKPTTSISACPDGFRARVGQDEKVLPSRALAEAWAKVRTAPGFRYCRLQFNNEERRPFIVAYPSATAEGRASTARKKFSGFKDAVGFAQSRDIAAENHGRQFASDLTREEIAAVASWRVEASRLAEMGVTVPSMAETIREALARLAESPDGRSVNDDLIAAFVAHKKDRAIGVRQVIDYESRLGRFQEAFEGRAVASITGGEVEAWISGLKKRKGSKTRRIEGEDRVSPQTRHHYRATVFSFFQWITPHRNPVSEIDPPQIADPDRDHYNPEEAKRLLDWILEHDMGLVPGCVLGLFCGVRTAERARIDLAVLDLSEPTKDGEFILKKGKVRSRSRAIPLPAAAKAWLLAQTRRAGPVVDMSAREFHRRLAIAHEKAGVRKIHNGFRHTFATFRGAVLRSSSRLKDEMGNSASVIDRRYRDARLQAEAKAFFALRPGEQKDLPIMFRRRVNFTG